MVDNDTLWILQPEYEWIKFMADDYYMVSKGKKYGIADGYGRIIIPCNFADIKYSSNERIFTVTKNMDAVIRQSYGDHIGLYDQKGSMIIPQVFESISEFDNGMAIASISDIPTEINAKGEVDESFISLLLETGLTKKGAACVYFYNRVIGLRPRCAEAHNNLGIHDLELENFKEGMQRLKLAHKLAPDDAAIADNLKQAKKDRKERRFNRVSNVLNVAATVVGVAATTSTAATGNPVDVSGLSNVTDTSESTSSVSNVNSTSSTNASQKEKKPINHGHYATYSRIYSNCVSELSKMESGLTECNVTEARRFQGQMKNARNKILEMGGTQPKSPFEDWTPCSKM